MALISIGAFAKRIKNLGRAMVYRNFQAGGRLHSTLVDGKVNIDDPEVFKFMREYGYSDGVGKTVSVKKKPDMRELGKRSAEKRHGKPKEDPLVVAARQSLESGGSETSDRKHNSLDYNENDSGSDDLPASKKITVNGKQRSTAHHTPPDEIDRDIAATEYLDMPMRAAVLRFGDQSAFKDWTAAVFKLAQLKGMEEEQARKRGDYIQRDVAESVVVMIDALSKALLSDVCMNIATSAMNMAKAGASRNEIEHAVRGSIERTIKMTKQQAVKKLQG